MKKKKFKIVLSNELDESFKKKLTKLLPKFLFSISLMSKEKMFEELKFADVFITKYLDIPNYIYPYLKKLKFIQIVISDYSKINLKLAKKYSVKVTNNQGANAISVSEHVLLMILSIYRNFEKQSYKLKKGVWNNLKEKNIELYGKTIGIIGMGNVGTEVAKRSLALGMKVFYYDILRKNISFEKKFKIKFLKINDLLKIADIVTYHVTLNKASINMINKKSIKLMKKNSILINTSRGKIQKEDDVFEALKNNQIFAAGLDVFNKEPLPYNSKLRKLKNIVLTPHCGPSKESYDRRVFIARDNILKIYKKRKIKNLKS